VLPFAIDESTARRRAEGELGDISTLRRVFLPGIVLSAEGYAWFEGVALDEEGKEAGYRQGELHRPFDHRLVLGTGDAAALYCPPGHSWPMGLVEPFDPRWLVDSECQHSSVDPRSAYDRIEPELIHEIHEQAAHDIGGRVDECKWELEAARYRYVLLPAWVGTYGTKQGVQHFVVHGRSGEVTSEESLDRELRAERSRMPARKKFQLGLGGVVLAFMVGTFIFERVSDGAQPKSDEEPGATAMPDPEPATLDLDVRAVGSDRPIRDARVWLHHRPDLIAESSADGTVALPVPPPEGRFFVAVDPSEYYLGSVAPFEGPPGDERFEIKLIPRSNLTEIQRKLFARYETKFPGFDQELGFLLIEADPGALGAVVTIEPSLPTRPIEPIVGHDPSGSPRLGDYSIEDPANPYLLVYALQGAEPGELRLTMDVVGDCALDATSPPLIPGYVTVVRARC
jgi:hypothetical protein